MNSQFESIRKNLDKILQNGLLFDHLYGSIDGIAQMIMTIYKTGGVNWASRVLDSHGNPLFTHQEQQQFTEVFEPYIGSILSFFENPKKGGALEYMLPDMSSVAKLRTNDLAAQMKDQMKDQMADQSGSPDTMIGIDNLYAKVINRLGMIDSVVNNYASKYGVLQMEKKSDVEPDIRLIPQPLAQLISNGLMALTGIPSPTSMEVMNKIKVPFRLIVIVIYLALDVARIAASVSGEDYQRKILSISVALLELLRGDWKKAILTFMGYYGTTPLLIGQMAKIFLTLFQTLSPTIQESLLFGALDTTKSFIIGILLAILKITAPEGVRKPLIELLEKIAKKKAEIDGTLTDAHLSARADYFAPTFEDFNNIQALMDDPEFICSTEFEELIEQVDNMAIINIILQILRLPVTKEFREYRCGKKPSKPFLTLVTEKAKEDKEKQEMFDKPFSMENIQMPVAVSRKNEEPSVEEPEVPAAVPSEEPTEESSAAPSEEPTETSSVIPSEEPEVPAAPSEEPEVPAAVSSEEQVEEPPTVPSEEQVEEPAIPLSNELAKSGGTRRRNGRKHTRKIRSHRR